MAIEGIDIWKTKLYEYNMNASSDRFKHDFIRAVNNTLDIYAIDMNLESKPAHIDATDDVIDVDVDHSFVIEAGVDRFLTQYGHKSGDMNIETAKNEFALSLRRALLDRDQEAATNADNDEVIAFFDED